MLIKKPPQRLKGRRTHYLPCSTPRGIFVKFMAIVIIIMVTVIIINIYYNSGRVLVSLLLQFLSYSGLVH